MSRRKMIETVQNFILQPCPYCCHLEQQFRYDEPELYRTMDGIWYVECGHCNARTDLCYRADRAIEAWNNDEIFQTDDPEYPEIYNEYDEI